MKRILLKLLIAFIAVLTGIILSSVKTDYSIEGARVLPIIAGCELWTIDEPIQTEISIAVACPGVDLVRIWPLPVVMAWDEGSCEDLENGPRWTLSET